jgi:epoxyqueuosine reductase
MEQENEPVDKKSPKENSTNEHTVNRRNFLKASALAAGAIAATGIPGQAGAEQEKKIPQSEIQECSEFPVEIRSDYKPFHQKNNVFTTVLLKNIGGLREKIFKFHGPGKIDNSRPGYTHLDWALKEGGYSLTEATTPGMPASIPGLGLNNWKQTTPSERKTPFENNYVFDKKCEFSSKREASAAIKTAAELYGADLVGITRRDKKWDYAGFVDPIHKEMFGWERFPFEPKTVIVLGFEMEYENYETAPSYISEAATGAAYARISAGAYQVAVFLKLLGYHSVSAGNDVGLSVPYAIAAGLGEPSRIGSVITPEFGPRVRLAKVYTDFDFVTYDKPIKFGAAEFCQNCKRCAEVCPKKAITFQDEPSFEPLHDGEKWFNNPGTKKYYNNMLECFKYWTEINAGCGACIAACPYNKPDMWHHRLVQKINKLVGGPVHELNRELDAVFGYGKTFDESAAKKYWARKLKQS